MVIEAGRLGCTREVLVIVAALSIQDPRERPVDKEAQADQSHARFKDDASDFATLHTLWRYLKDQQKALSHSAFRRMCKNEYLHYLRIREWQDLHAQLRSACRSVRIDPDVATSAPDAEPDWDAIHKALLAGLLSHVGARDQAKREYAGARGARFGISPGSALFRKQPDLVMAAELVETSRLWARVNAAIEPEWAEEVGAHVVARTVSEPRWSRRAGAAVATERVTLYGVPLVTDRTIQYARIDAEAAREIFIRSAFVEGDWEPQHDFWKTQRRHAGPGGRARGAGPAARHRRRRRGALRVLRRAHPARRAHRAALRPVVARRAAATPRPAHPHRGRPHLGGRRAGVGRRLPAHLAAGRPRPRRHLPVLAGRGRRRRDRARARRRAQPGDLRRLRLAGARAARRPRRRPAQVAAEGDPPPLRAHARPRDGRARRGRPGARHRSPRSWRGCSTSAPASASRRGSGTSRGCPTTCGSPSASTAPVAGSWPAARTSTPCGRRPAARCEPGWRGPAPRWSAPA